MGAFDFQFCLRRVRSLTVLAAAFLAAGVAYAKSPEMTDLKVFPPDINLKTRQDHQSLVLQATYDDGLTRDVTSQAKFSFGDKNLIRFTNYTLYPLIDGTTELRIKFSGRTLNVPVKVQEAKVVRPTSFIQDVIPVLTKAGCNAGS